ncbi:MAG: ornithine carbamoyltransferase [Candidatus Methanomethylicota archaeon]|uniref:Ornithine carbamoyltransferase n=1 Tax=Thermoproteota archaeon TaxID=2056631 RepID=A0A497EZ15_9CREN|nr:MAG: ornithine carbamoyltransferase [Candidatus Verstraetearchaeota archaeon]
MSSIRGRDFLTIWDLSASELLEVLNRAIEVKQRKTSFTESLLSGKSIALLFQKPSTRTRVSFEVGIRQLGGQPIYLNWSELQLSRGETISDTVKVLERYVDCIIARVYNHRDLEVMAEKASIPIINALSDSHHPCQALADYLTIMEKMGKLRGVNLTFIGDGGNNVCTSLIQGASRLGVNITICSPKKYMPSEDLIEKAREEAAKHGAKISLTEDPKEAVKEADFIYTDVWVSMGKEKEAEERLRDFKPYQVNLELLKHAPQHSMVMHCLPALRGLEITDEVLDSPRAIVWEQAENRLHVQKSLLAMILS